MSITTESVEFQIRRGTAAAWASANPILGSGEPGFETDSKKFKIGDGSTTYAALEYQGVSSGLVPTSVKTGTYTAAPGDYVLIDSTAAARTLNLPTAPADGTQVGAKLIATATPANQVTINAGSGDTFNVQTSGTTTEHLSQLDQAMVFQYNATTHVWIITDDSLAVSQLTALFLPIPSVGSAAVNDEMIVETTSPLTLGYALRQTRDIDVGYTGPLPTGGVVGQQRVTLRRSYAFDSIDVNVGTAPGTTTIIFDVQKNGTSIWNVTNANRPTIAVAAQASTNGTPDTTTFVSGDVLTFSVLQVGSGPTGSDLLATLRLRPTA